MSLWDIQNLISQILYLEKYHQFEHGSIHSMHCIWLVDGFICDICLESKENAASLSAYIDVNERENHFFLSCQSFLSTYDIFYRPFPIQEHWLIWNGIEIYTNTGNMLKGIYRMQVDNSFSTFVLFMMGMLLVVDTKISRVCLMKMVFYVCTK